MVGNKPVENDQISRYRNSTIELNIQETNCSARKGWPLDITTFTIRRSLELRELPHITARYSTSVQSLSYQHGIVPFKGIAST